MKKVLISIAIIGLCFLESIAQQTLQVSAGLNRNIDYSKLRQFDALLQQYIDSQWIAGATYIFTLDGNILAHNAEGYANVETREMLRTDHIFRIASQTKAITSVAALMLMEEGKLLLDDPVSKYLPAFTQLRVLTRFHEMDSSYESVPAKSPITIRQLLAHTSGIGYAQIGSPQYNALAAKSGVFAGIGVPDLRLEDQVNIMASLPLEHQPGERFTYGLNTDILGRLIEVVSGQSLDVFFRERIFKPLGMTDTHFYLPSQKANRLVALHGESEQGKVEVLKRIELQGKTLKIDYPLEQNGQMYSGGGGLVSTALDYAIFMQMILNGGTYNGQRLLSANSINMMSTNQIGTNNGEFRFGLGFGIGTEATQAKNGLSKGTLEWGGAFSSSYWIDVNRKVVAQLFINQWPNSHGDIHEKFKIMMLSSILNRP